MSTRKRTNHTSTPVSSSTASNLPLPRKSKGLTPVSAPLSNTRLNRLIYLLALLAVLLGAFYSWRLLQWKTEVGGWWNLALGKRPPQFHTHGQEQKSPKMGWRGQPKKTGGGEDTVEDRINALAEALGIPSRELASAIAGAVREYVPPASLSSVAAQARKTGKGKHSDVIEELIKDPEERNEGEGGSTGIVGGVASGLGSVVGLDEPPED